MSELDDLPIEPIEDIRDVRDKLFTRFTDRQWEILKLLADGTTPNDVARQLGITRQAVSTVVTATRGRFAEVMIETGSNDARLVAKLNEALDAKETKFFKMPDGPNSAVLEERELAAWGPRINALDIALKLRGAYPKQYTQEIHDNSIHITIQGIGVEVKEQ